MDLGPIRPFIRCLRGQYDLPPYTVRFISICGQPGEGLLSLIPFPDNIVVALPSWILIIPDRLWLPSTFLFVVVQHHLAHASVQLWLSVKDHAAGILFDVLLDEYWGTSNGWRWVAFVLGIPFGLEHDRFVRMVVKNNGHYSEDVLKSTVQDGFAVA